LETTQLATFAVLDAARLGGNQLAVAQQLNGEFTSLYKGRSEERLADFAPYLFPLEAPTAFSEWLLTLGWGRAWGIFCCTAAPAAELHQHLRRFLLVGLEGEKPIYFRFYDPRVLRTFLPTCNAEQLQRFFGPIAYFWLEDEDPAYGSYYLLGEEGQLLVHRVPHAELLETFG